jgi:hypothetical protein
MKIGKDYKINHRRKGTFNIRVTSINDEWVTGEIIDGKTKKMLPENSREKGEEIKIRRSLFIIREELTN